MTASKKACGMARRTPNAKWSHMAVVNRNNAIATRARLHDQLIAAQTTTLTKGATILAAQGQATLDEIADLRTEVNSPSQMLGVVLEKVTDLHNVAILARAPVNSEGHCDECKDKGVAAQSRCSKDKGVAAQERNIATCFMDSSFSLKALEAMLRLDTPISSTSVLTPSHVPSP